MLLQSGNFRLKGKKALLNQAEIPVVTVMDVTETPIERPQGASQFCHKYKCLETKNVS
jgi:hypothetical protein